MSRPTDWIHAAVERYERPLLSYCRGLLGHDRHDQAADVVQDAFVRLCDQDRDAVEGHLSAWLFTVCRNRCMDLLRVRGRESAMNPDHESVALVGDPSSDLQAHEQLADLRRAIADLPENQQDVVRLKFLHDHSYADISRITGQSVPMVGYLLHTAMTTLRARLGAKPTGLTP